MKRPKPLTSAIHLHTAAIYREQVAAYIDNERMGCGIITEITVHSVRIGDANYMRDICEFYAE